jgi:hypothetical protein
VDGAPAGAGEPETTVDDGVCGPRLTPAMTAVTNSSASTGTSRPPGLVVIFLTRLGAGRQGVPDHRTSAENGSSRGHAGRLAAGAGVESGADTSM